MTPLDRIEDAMVDLVRLEVLSMEKAAELCLVVREAISAGLQQDITEHDCKASPEDGCECGKEDQP